MKVALFTSRYGGGNGRTCRDLGRLALQGTAYVLAWERELFWGKRAASLPKDLRRPTGILMMHEVVESHACARGDSIHMFAFSEKSDLWRRECVAGARPEHVQRW